MSTALKDVSVVREGSKLLVPEGVTIETAIRALQKQLQLEQQDFAIDQKFELGVAEGAYALLRTLQEMCGFVNPQATPGFFGDTPPTYYGIEVAPGKVEMVPWGQLTIPNVSGYLQPSIWGKSPKFQLAGVVKGKDKGFVDKVCARIREMAANESIYRGKAIRCNFPKLERGMSLEDFFPKFMSLEDVKEENLILSDETAALLRTALFVPVERTEKCREHGVPLKRGILLEGPFGVGKTMASLVTAQKCVDNGWTFIHLGNVDNLAEALAFARQYQPAVVFAEDIDQLLSDPDTRDLKVNGILNEIDGIESKGNEVITVLTTNNLDNITTAMLRPGRLDAVISVRAPDAAAAQRLVRLYAGGLLAPGQDLTHVGELLEGHIPAVIREVVERSKLGAIGRDSRVLVSSDIEVAALGMRAHVELLKPREPDTREPIEKAADSLVRGAHELLTRMQPANGMAKSAGVKELTS